MGKATLPNDINMEKWLENSSALWLAPYFGTAGMSERLFELKHLTLKIQGRFRGHESLEEPTYCNYCICACLQLLQEDPYLGFAVCELRYPF